VVEPVSTSIVAASLTKKVAKDTLVQAAHIAGKIVKTLIPVNITFPTNNAIAPTPTPGRSQSKSKEFQLK